MFKDKRFTIAFSIEYILPWCVLLTGIPAIEVFGVDAPNAVLQAKFDRRFDFFMKILW